MQVTQADFRTVHIRRDGLSFFLRYNLYQDGEERFPESINCREDTVVAYFLTSTIRDYLAETPWGFAVERSWKIIPEGQFALAFCLDLPEGPSAGILLPGAAGASAVTAEGLRALGHNTAYPNALYFLAKPRSVLVFSDSPRGSLEPGCVSGRRVIIDEEPLVRTEIRMPGTESGESESAPAARPSRGKVQALPGYFRSPGGYEQTLRFGVVSAPSGEVFQRGIEVTLERFADSLRPRGSLDAHDCRRISEAAIRDCLAVHLVDRGGIYGLRTSPRAAELSSAAGVALADLLVQFFPRDEDMLDSALRLGDFALKGQHPGGLFYGTYFLKPGSWLDPGTAADAPPPIALEESAAVACALLRLGETLRGRGLPARRYLMAAERMAQALLAAPEDLAEIGHTLRSDSLLSVGTGIGGVGLVELYLRLHRLFGRDAYKKAVATLVRRFYPETQGGYSASLEDPDALSLEAALRRARGAILLAESGHRLKGLEECLNRILPWICVNRRGLPDGLSMAGGAVDRLGDRRLVFRGFELALAALALETRLGSCKGGRMVKMLVPQLIGFTLQKPLGTAWLEFDPAAKVAVGPIDSRILVGEIEALLLLQRRFPGVFEGSPVRE